MKTLQKLATTAFVATFLPLAAGVAEAGTIAVIDPLMVTQQTAIIPPFVNSPTSSVGITSSLLGSVTRTMTIQQQSASQTGDSIVSSIPRGGQPGLSLSTGDFTDGKVTLGYGTFGPIDFTSGGAADRVALGLISADLPGGVITVTLNGISQSITVGTENPAPPPAVISFPFAAFAGLNATSVTSFSVMLDPVTAGDMSIEFLETQGPMGTPEPATMLGLMAVAGFGASALKKKQR